MGIKYTIYKAHMLFEAWEASRKSHTHLPAERVYPNMDKCSVFGVPVHVLYELKVEAIARGCRAIIFGCSGLGTQHVHKYIVLCTGYIYTYN